MTKTCFFDRFWPVKKLLPTQVYIFWGPNLGSRRDRTNGRTKEEEEEDAQMNIDFWTLYTKAPSGQLDNIPQAGGAKLTQPNLKVFYFGITYITYDGA